MANSEGNTHQQAQAPQLTVQKAVQKAAQAPLRQGKFSERFGPWAVVTGASSGIGYEFARLLAQAGVHVALVARSEERLNELAGRLHTEEQVQTRVIVADLSLPEGVAAVEDGTADLDVGLYVASAGFGHAGEFLEADPQTELEMIQVNCAALLAGAMHFGGRIARRGRGGMIFFSSVVGFQAAPYAANYGATKAYVQSLGEALRLELGPQGVEVLVSAPGPTHTGFAARANMQMDSAMDPKVVAQETFNALGKKGTVLPGTLSKLMVWPSMLIPRAIRNRIFGSSLKKMAIRQADGQATSSRLANP